MFGSTDPFRPLLTPGYQPELMANNAINYLTVLPQNLEAGNYYG